VISGTAGARSFIKISSLSVELQHVSVPGVFYHMRDQKAREQNEKSAIAKNIEENNKMIEKTGKRN